MNRLDVPDLDALERRLETAFTTGRPAGLDVLGYGEISCVVAWPAPAGPVAAKRLPTFRSAAALGDYRRLFDEYLERLADAGVRVLPTRLATLATRGGIAAYVVQPALEPDRLVVRALASAAGPARSAILEEILGAAGAAGAAGIGLDAQLSNWGLLAGVPHYFDVTTPLLRDAAGRHRLDAGVFLASLPWAVRGAVRRFLVVGIMDRYFDPRSVMIDLAANLVKEGLADLMHVALELANRRADPPIERAEVDRYYAADARLWSVLQRLRRLDRAWQLRVRRRPYPFLLPGRIDR